MGKKNTKWKAFWDIDITDTEEFSNTLSNGRDIRIAITLGNRRDTYTPRNWFSTIRTNTPLNV